MTKPSDDFEAVRILVDALTPFENQDRERIIRWAREKLGMSSASVSGASLPTPGLPAPAASTAGAASAGSPSGTQDIRSFLSSKNPKTEAQLVATVGYYYRFVAAPHERKETISGADVVEACRQADRKRPSRQGQQSMINAFTAGVVDRVDGGKYRLNTVGENLVAVVLGNAGSDGEVSVRKPRAAKKRGTKGAKKVKK